MNMKIVIYKPKREAQNGSFLQQPSEETKPVNMLISDVQPPEPKRQGIS